MKVVFASSEAVPYSKTGGLADVASSLCKAFDRAGHDVWLFTPFYPREMVRNGLTRPAVETTVSVSVGVTQKTASFRCTRLPGSNVRVALVDQPDYFDRAGLYSENGRDYPDNCARFVFFSRAVMEGIRTFGLQPEIIHANDWQTGLMPALLEIEERSRGLEKTASIFTIHNIAFQGSFWHWDMLLTGLDWKYFNFRQMECFGHLNLMKTGISFADMITTVSPTYAREIQTPEYGCGLHAALAARADDLVGILNGVDTDLWNPATDPALAQNYTVETFETGKARCKADLQQQMQLPVLADRPLMGMVSRMTSQKGFDLLDSAAELFLQRDVQMVVLGTGERRYERMCVDLAKRFPDKMAVRIGFDEPLAHRIEAGADIYLMPSRYEPCGLNQMYSQIYGTVPIVRAVGGLADSVVDATPENLAGGTATGFTFHEYDPRELYRQVRRAMTVYRDRPTWKQLVTTGMKRDWSWNRSAAEYIEVYQRALAKRRSSCRSSTIAN